MNESARNLVAEAMKLQLRDRAEVAAELLASLDGEPDEDVESAWAVEIEARIERIRSGKAKGRPWSEARRSIERRDG